MRLSDLQRKEIINMNTGKKLGIIIDVILDISGNIRSLILEEKHIKRFAGKEEYQIEWKQIAKIGDDIILIRDKYDDKNKPLV